MSQVVIGNTIGIYKDNVLIGCLTSNSFSSTNEEIPTTCKDNNGAYQMRPGSNTAEMPFEGNFNPAATYGLSDLLGIHKNRTRVGVKMADTESGLYIIGYAYLNTLEWSGALNAASTFSGAFKVDGSWDYGTET
jgi:hypothetical protein